MQTLKPSQYYTILNLLVLSLVVYCAVDVFYTLADSKIAEVKTQQATTQHLNKMETPPKHESLDHYLAALNVDLFGREDAPAPETKEIEIENLEATKLNITLLGTVSGVDETAVAVIQEPAKRSQSLYKIGDTVQNATIVKILRGKVILSVGGKNQVLTMEENTAGSKQTFGSRSPRTPTRSPSPATTPASTSTITLERTMVNEALNDVTKLLSQVRVRPHYRDGKPDGLMLTQIRPNTIFTRLGLRNGDVIQNVGGQQIGNPDDIMSFYEELKSGSPVSLEIMRRGRQKSLSYRFR